MICVFSRNQNKRRCEIRSFKNILLNLLFLNLVPVFKVSLICESMGSGQQKVLEKVRRLDQQQDEGHFQREVLGAGGGWGAVE